MEEKNKDQLLLESAINALPLFYNQIHQEFLELDKLDCDAYLHNKADYIKSLELIDSKFVRPWSVYDLYVDYDKITSNSNFEALMPKLISLSKSAKSTMKVLDQKVSEYNNIDLVIINLQEKLDNFSNQEIQRYEITKLNTYADELKSMMLTVDTLLVKCQEDFFFAGKIDLVIEFNKAFQKYLNNERETILSYENSNSPSLQLYAKHIRQILGDVYEKK